MNVSTNESRDKGKKVRKPFIILVRIYERKNAEYITRQNSLQSKSISNVPKQMLNRQALAELKP
jgi:hypothetical protein